MSMSNIQTKDSLILIIELICIIIWVMNQSCLCIAKSFCRSVGMYDVTCTIRESHTHLQMFLHHSSDRAYAGVVTTMLPVMVAQLSSGGSWFGHWPMLTTHRCYQCHHVLTFRDTPHSTFAGLWLPELGIISLPTLQPETKWLDNILLYRLCDSQSTLRVIHNKLEPKLQLRTHKNE